MSTEGSLNEIINVFEKIYQVLSRMMHTIVAL